MFRTLLLVCLPLGRPTAPAAPPTPAAPASAVVEGAGRVIVLGFDGADAATVAELMERGELPNLARIAEQGCFAPLTTVTPPESPTAWASLNSGQNPGKHGVPGFVKRSFSGSQPAATFGHLVNGKRALAEFPEQPLPLWSGGVYAAVAGAGVTLCFLVAFLVLLRMQPTPAIALALALGLLGAGAGWKVRGYLPDELPHVSNPNAAEPFWDVAARAGVASIVLDAAQAFDRPSPAGADVLWGLGTPDVRGKIGDWYIYTSDAARFDGEKSDGVPPRGILSEGTAGNFVRVVPDGQHIRSSVFGPQNFWEKERLEAELAELEAEARGADVRYEASIELERQKRLLADRLDELKAGIPVDLEVELLEASARIRIGEETQEVALGGWSDFYHLRFDLNPLVKAHAVTRCRLISLEPFKLFLNTCDIDPARPIWWQPLSSPFDYCESLARSGAFETYGWACATMPFKDGEIPIEALLEDIEFTMAWRERLTYAELARGDWRLFMSVFSEVDRIQHMTTMYSDPANPMHDPAEAARLVDYFGRQVPLSGVIEETYRQIDRVVGRVLAEFVRPTDTLVLCADHGSQSFHRQVHLNNWLASEGYLALREDVTRGSAFSSYVDWSRTRAYALGLGFIFVNLEGREPQGIVAPEDAPGLVAEIAAKLLALTDPASGERACSEVYRTAEVHSGPLVAEEAEIICGFAPRYRVSWSTAGGGLRLRTDPDSGEKVPADVFEDNDSPWSGDHTSADLSTVRGIFFCSRKLELPPQGPNVLHVAPTVLDLLGVAPSAAMDLAPLRAGS
jgi:predicted AlkP superfamily phosphohydrolase/phosphomutase